jgi:hypothetical protein
VSEATKTPLGDRLGAELSLAVAELEEAAAAFLEARTRLFVHAGDNEGLAEYRAEGSLETLVGQILARRHDKRVAAWQRTRKTGRRA